MSQQKYYQHKNENPIVELITQHKALVFGIGFLGFLVIMAVIADLLGSPIIGSILIAWAVIFVILWALFVIIPLQLLDYISTEI